MGEGVKATMSEEGEEEEEEEEEVEEEAKGGPLVFPLESV